jgi:stage IV sporulation protein FB
MDDFFKWRFPIGRLFGMTIRVHIIYVLVLLGLMLRFGLDKNAAQGIWIDVLLLATIVVVSTLLHEMGHCFGARSVGGEADEIMLWPLGGVAEISYLPANPWAHFVTVACGPLVNVVICLLSGLALAFCFDPPIRPAFNLLWYPFRDDMGLYHMTLWGGGAHHTSSLTVMAVVWTFYINWFLLLFNVLLIGLPYDGGGLGRSILWPYVGYHRATMYMVTTGFIISGLMFMGVFIWVDLQGLAFLSVYTFLMCRREWINLEGRGEESLFGYDFSAGYTSLEKDMPAQQSPPRKKQNFIQRYLQRRNARRVQREQELQEAEERRMDELLEKIQREGKQSLTDEENRFLKRVSDRYRNRH